MIETNYDVSTKDIQCKPTLLMKLKAAVENKNTKPRKSLAKDKVFPSKEKKDIFFLLDDINHDPESMSIFTSNHFIKFFIFDALVDLIDPYCSDEFLRKVLTTLVNFMDSEYDKEKKAFNKRSLAPLYGRLLINLIPYITDLGIDESFYSEEENATFQNKFLSLAIYILKTVKLSSIVAHGLKPKHLQFLIIHFTKSHLIPEILLAIAENLKDDSKLYETDLQAPDKQLSQVLENIYSISMKSICLLIKLYINNYNMLRTVKQMNFYLAIYGRDKISKETSSSTNKHSILVRGTQMLMKDLYHKLQSESESQYRSMRYQQIVFYMQLILYHFDNLNGEWKVKVSKNLVGTIKRILNRIAGHEAFRKLNKSEIFARNFSFSIIIKIIEYSKVQFNTDYIQNKTYKLYFELTWLHAIESKSEMACMAFKTFVRTIERESTLATLQLSQKVLNIIHKFLLTDKESNIKSLSLNFRMLLSIFEHHTINSLKSNLEKDVMPVANQFLDKLKELTYSSNGHLKIYIQFLSNLIQCSHTTKNKPTYLFREQVFSALSVFEDIVNFNFDYDLESKIYSSALDLIKLMTKYYSQDKLMSDYNSIFFEILMQIDSNLEDYSESSECEKLIQFFDDVNIS